jgi:hypothetical protein
MANEIVWRKARASGGQGGNCVEVGQSAGGTDVRVRDTKRREAGHLAVDADTWRTFMDEIKAGQHTRLDRP